MRTAHLDTAHLKQNKKRLKITDRNITIILGLLLRFWFILFFLSLNNFICDKRLCKNIGISHRHLIDVKIILGFFFWHSFFLFLSYPAVNF